MMLDDVANANDVEPVPVAADSDVDAENALNAAANDEEADSMDDNKALSDVSKHEIIASGSPEHATWRSRIKG
jgi:hypothetical protein